MNDSSIERQREHFNSVAEAYARGRREPTHLRIKNLIWAEAMRGLDDFRGRELRVLEAMCGYAEGRDLLTSHLTTQFRYSGFDYSDNIVESLRAEHPGLDIWQADVTTFEATPEGYDVIILIGGLHHVPDHASDVVKRLTAGLAPGGIILNFEPTHGNPLTKWIRDGIYRRNAIFDQVTERAFPVADLENMFLAAGLRARRQFHPGLLAYVLYYNPYAFPWLNRGGEIGVNIAFALDRLFMHNRIGRWLSFATLGVWEKPA